MEPLIYTSKGNVPVASLTLDVSWDITDNYIKCVERYTDAMGEVVKQSANVKLLKGMGLEAVLGRIG